MDVVDVLEGYASRGARGHSFAATPVSTHVHTSAYMTSERHDLLILVQ